MNSRNPKLKHNLYFILILHTSDLSLKPHRANNDSQQSPERAAELVIMVVQDPQIGSLTIDTFQKCRASHGKHGYLCRIRRAYVRSGRPSYCRTVRCKHSRKLRSRCSRGILKGSTLSVKIGDRRKGQTSMQVGRQYKADVRGFRRS